MKIYLIFFLSIAHLIPNKAFAQVDEITSNENNLGLCLTLIYTHGLHSVYRNYTNVKLLQDNTEYNYGLENRGSFFGMGLSLNFKRSFIAPLYDWF